MTTDDPTLALLRNEATGPSPQAWYLLGVALVARQQFEEARLWHRRAADAGHPLAQIELARMLMHGVGTATDPSAAAEWLLRAERSGNPVAGYFLAMMALGDATQPFNGLVNERLRAAVQANYPPALRAAAIHFGRKANSDDQTLCLQLLERAAGHGDVLSARLLAERLARGEGCVPQPVAASALWAQLAARGIGRLPEIAVPLAPAQGGPTRTLALEEVLEAPPLQDLSVRPHVMQIDGLLSADECRLLVANAQPTLQRSRTVNPETGLPVEIELRTSSDASLDPILEDFSLRLVQLRMARAARVPLICAEHLTVLRYEPGQEYRPHRDYRPQGSIEKDRPEAGNRTRTICAYLNQVEAGGETVFPVAGLSVAPVAGRAVVFDNLHADGSPDIDSLHAGLPVQRGEKWLATLWLRQRQYRGW